MHQQTKIAAAVLMAVGGFSAWAQQAPAATEPQQIERVTVTGSAIKRLDAETAVPITVFRMKDIKQQGLTTVEQILSTLTASQTSLGTSQAVGASTGGASFADLRGVGANKTLSLIHI